VLINSGVHLVEATLVQLELERRKKTDQMSGFDERTFLGHAWNWKRIFEQGQKNNVEQCYACSMEKWGDRGTEEEKQKAKEEERTSEWEHWRAAAMATAAKSKVATKATFIVSALVWREMEHLDTPTADWTENNWERSSPRMFDTPRAPSLTQFYAAPCIVPLRNSRLLNITHQMIETMYEDIGL
jgi:hypothetical protein